MPPFTLPRPRLSRRAFTAGAAATAVVAVAGCGDEDSGSDADGGGGTGSGPDQVTYLTAFGASAHDAFVFVADERGFFADADLDVTIEIGSGTANYPPMLAGQAHFSYSDLAGMFVDLGRGELESGDFRVLSSVHQRTLVAIIAPEDAGINSPADLEGKRIGAFTGSVTELLLPAYADLSGWEFDPDQVENASPADLFGLLAAGHVDALSTFNIQRGVIEGIIGGPTVMFPMDQYLSDLLGTGLITTVALADENPDLVARFRDAALEGLRYTIAHPEEAIDILAERVPDAIGPAGPGPLVGQIQVMTPYVTADGEDRIGVIEEAHVVRCISVLQSAGLVPAGLVAEDIIGDGTLLASA